MINESLMHEKLKTIYTFLTSKYFEVDEFVTCLILSMISRTHLIVLGQPGIAKSAILRDLVLLIDFENNSSTPYFHIQMGSDVSPNNVFGAPDIAYFKSHGIIKRHYKGFLPDATIAFCSEFYRVSDQVANSGLLTILNEGEFKNGTETIKTNLRFFMADTNFFPKSIDDLDVEETDLKLQALHDRFLSRYYLQPIQEMQNKIDMILMADKAPDGPAIKLSELVEIQNYIGEIELPFEIAKHMASIAHHLQVKHKIFISPRRLKLSRNLVKASAFFSSRSKCTLEDLQALAFTFWQKQEDIQIVKDTILDVLGKPSNDARSYEKLLKSITEEFERHVSDEQHLPGYNPDLLYKQLLSDLMKLIETIEKTYPTDTDYPEIQKIKKAVHITFKTRSDERQALSVN